MPPKCAKFTGLFSFKASGNANAREVVILEDTIELEFCKNSKGSWNITGKGSNEFGDFRVSGRVMHNANKAYEVVMYKLYNGVNVVESAPTTALDVESVFCCAPGCTDKTDESIPILLCDVCDKGYHISCLGLDKVPEGDVWFCNQCTLERPSLLAQAKSFLQVLTNISETWSAGTIRSRMAKIFELAAPYGWVDAKITNASLPRSFTPTKKKSDLSFTWPKPRTLLDDITKLMKHLTWIIDPVNNVCPGDGNEEEKPLVLDKKENGHGPPTSTVSQRVHPTSEQEPGDLTRPGGVFDRRYFREESVPGVALPMYSAIPPPNYKPKSVQVHPQPTSNHLYGADSRYKVERHRNLSWQQVREERHDDAECRLWRCMKQVYLLNSTRSSQLLAMANKPIKVAERSKRKVRDLIDLKRWRQEFKDKAMEKKHEFEEGETLKKSLALRYPKDKYLQEVYFHAAKDQSIIGRAMDEVKKVRKRGWKERKDGRSSLTIVSLLFAIR